MLVREAKCFYVVEGLMHCVSGRLHVFMAFEEMACATMQLASIFRAVWDNLWSDTYRLICHALYYFGLRVSSRCLHQPPRARKGEKEEEEKEEQEENRRRSSKRS